MAKPDSLESNKHKSALSEPLFLRYFPSSCFSTISGWLVRFLLGWSAWELTHSALWVGVVAGAMLFPTLLLSPIFGIISDRINPRNGLLITVSVHALVAGIAGLTYLFGWFTLPWLILLATLLGAASAAHTPIRLALIPRLVTRDALPSAIGYSAIIFNTSRILGPALGAWLITQTSMPMAFFTAVLLLTIALVFLLSVRITQPEERRENSPFLNELKAGFSYVKRHRGIRLILAFTLINGLLGRTVIELLPALSGKLLNGDSRTLATLTAAAGVGSIIGGLIVSRQSGNEHRLLNLVMGSLLLGALALLGIGQLDELSALCAAIACISMITTIVGTCSQALTQLVVDEDYRGRVMSLWAVLALGSPAIGTLAMGALADVLGFPTVLTAFALLSIPAVLFLYKRRNWLI
ncbi:MAG: MFS transporter [Proteobacteria bacterium]|nr:MFS transporter [Pseudomonadota bacterium]